MDIKQWRVTMGNNKTGGGIGFAGLLTIAFVVLKLCKVINWSWVWVLSPLWISASIVIIILVIAGIMIWKNNR